MPAEIVVSGSLALGENESGTPVPQDAGSLTANQPVQVRSLSGEVVAEAKTDATGSFAIATATAAEGSGAKLTGAGGTAALVYEIVGIIKKDQDDKVQGFKKSIVVDPGKLERTSPGSGTLQIGTHTTRGIGAIKGKVKLEGGASAIGADVYVPGTSFLAKADESGEFVLAFLNPGIYEIRIERDGYGSFAYPEVRVEKNDTTILPEATLSVSQGPSILSFATANGENFARSPELQVKFTVKNAVKFKLSQWPDFRYAFYLPVDLTQPAQAADFVVTGSDGPQTVYLRAADADGLEVDATLDVIFDSTLPTVPDMEIDAPGAQAPGYSRTRSITLRPAGCDDVAKLYVSESAGADPKPADFQSACSPSAGVAFQLADADGTHTLHLWALDATGQVSGSPAQLSVELDRDPPTLTVTPPTGASNASISVNASLDETGAVHYSIDGSTPTIESSELTGNLILIGNTTLKAIGFDQAGNASAVASRNYIIDADAPILGSIDIASGAEVTKNRTVTVNISAINADYFWLSENPAFNTGSWQSYVSAPSYTFASNTDGTKTIYLKFKDTAGNQLGQNGELSDSIVYDATPPPESGMTLYYPESPSGSFDKMLLWKDTQAAAGVHYEIEVHEDQGYADLVRAGTSTGMSWKVNPAFSSTGIYYWRVRAVDEAGNASDWVEGGTEKRFEIKLFGKTYVSTRRIDQPVDGAGFGVRMAKRSGGGDLYLVANTQDKGNGCPSCSTVDLIDWSTKQTLETFTSGSTDRDAFGASLEQCDLNGDGTDDIIVGAPLQPLRKNVAGLQRTFSNAGAVYAYDGSTFDQLFAYALDPNYSPNRCNEQYSASECKIYGWQDWYGPDFFNYLWVSDTRQMTGLGLACVRQAGADSLAIGSPGWSNGSFQSVGKVEVVALAGTSPFYSVQGSLVGSPTGSEWQSDQFGRTLAFLENFKLNGHDGPAIAISAPGRNGSGNQRGAVMLYDTALNLLSTISGAADYDGYGRVLTNLGNLDDDSGSYEELAVSGQSVVRIYAGETAAANPAVLKSIKRLGNDNGGFGLSVASVGDITGDGLPEIAVADPVRQISGNWGAGTVYLYDYADLDATDASSVDEKTLYRITGSTTSGTYTGQNILLGDDDDNDGILDSIRISTSGLGNGRGSVHEFSLVSMAPALPTQLEGSATSATFGYRVVAAPDFDGDGTNDFIISSPNVNYVHQAVGRLDFVSGRNNAILKTVFGRNQNQKLGTDLLYLDGSIYALSQDGMMLRFDKNDVLFINDINDYQNGSWNYRYPRRFIASSNSERTGIVQEPMNINGAYSPDSYEKVIALHSTGGAWDGTQTRYGSLLVFDRYYSDSKYSSDCSPSGTDSSCKCMIYGTASKEEFGYAGAFVPDFNGDGMADIAVGAPDRDNGDGTRGAVYVFNGAQCRGKANLGVDDAIEMITPSDLDAAANTMRFGANLHSLADMDGAGANNGTLIIGNSHWFNTSFSAESEVFFASHTTKAAKLVHEGVTLYATAQNPTDGNNLTVTMSISTNAPPVWSTTCTASGNDLTFELATQNGSTSNAYSWDIISAITNSASCTALAVAASTPGAPSNTTLTPLATTNMSGGTSGALVEQAHLVMPAGSLFGANIINIGDRDKDGFAELAISIPKAQGMSSATAGQVAIYSSNQLVTGSAAVDYPSNAEIIKFYSPTSAFSNFGSSIAQTDVNGDGIDDFLIGAPLYSNSSQGNIGAAFIYYVKGVNTD